jgi:hypothetical protein
MDLHWLPVRARVEFKVQTTVYNWLICWSHINQLVSLGRQTRPTLHPKIQVCKLWRWCISDVGTNAMELSLWTSISGKLTRSICSRRD